MIKVIIYTMLIMYITLTIVALYNKTLDINATLWAMFNLLLGVIAGKKGGDV